MTPSVDLQTAVYQELDKGKYPVAETVPYSEEDLPLITIQDLSRETNFTKTNKNRYTFSITIDGWSASNSSIEVKQIEEFIYQTVMNLEVKNYTIEMINLELNQNLKEEKATDRVVFHSIQQFEITISKEGEN